MDLETAQIEPMLVMIFSPIALLFDPVPFYPLHASQAEPQKASHLCVLLLQVVSFTTLHYISSHETALHNLHYITLASELIRM